MTFKPAIWFPVAVLMSFISLIGVVFAASQLQPELTAIPAALALGLGLWAERLRQAGGTSQPRGRLDALEAMVSELRGELNETHERLDVAERLLTEK